MRYCGIQFDTINKTHIDQLEPLDKLLIYMAIDDGVFYRSEHGAMFKMEFECLGILLKRLKKSGYVDCIAKCGIWFLTDNGAQKVKSIVSEHNVDTDTVSFMHNYTMHEAAKKIIFLVKGIKVNMPSWWLLASSF